MTKKEALNHVFNASPALVQVLKLHRDGLCHQDKATFKGRQLQTVKNQCLLIIKLFGVTNMNEAVRHAIYFGIIPLKRNRTRITQQWSEELLHRHHKYIQSLTTAQQRELGME